MSLTELETALDLIEINADTARFNGRTSDELVSSAEAAIGITLPPTYRIFLLRLGCGSIYGEEFYGIPKRGLNSPSVPNAIWLTLNERKAADLPESLILVADNGLGGWYAIDTSRKNPDGDSPVVDWFSNEQPTEIVAEDFGAFLLQRLRQALDRQ